MACTVSKREGVVYEAKIVAEPEVVKKEVENICKEIRKNAKIPGFRPGKAPVNIIKKQYKDLIEENLVRAIVPKELDKGIKEANLVLISEPYIEDLKYDDRNNTLECVVIFEVKPEIDLKPEDYKGIKVTKSVRKIEDKDVEQVLESLLNREAKFEEVDRPAQKGDLVDLEYVAIIDGEEKKGEVTAVLGENQLWSEVDSAVIGKKKGEEGEVSFKAPEDEKYGDAAGKDVTLKFKVLAVKEKKLPELNDEFAKKFGVETVEELKSKIREDLEKAEAERQQEEVEDKIVEELLKKVGIPVPSSLLSMEIKAQAENQIMRLAQFGVDVKQISPQTIAEMVRPTAEKTVKVKLLLEKVAELEGLEVTDEDIEKEIEKLANMAFNGDTVLARQSLEERNLMPMVKQDVLRQKALDRLIELAEIEEVEFKEEKKEEDKEEQ
ncbi:trigger factor [Desulfurobacterium atlanticum]|uniref:Trigger factor n=1 Tax=Desulfurobacterium atlanticum TaxID=240169 RepID=A0A238ZDL8_9BACT|nr:trigger factor [Desulfurobacterium atlanticum]SNR81380.1 trigger factor [Desulfurobacterium atlanticum]